MFPFCLILNKCFSKYSNDGLSYSASRYSYSYSKTPESIQVDHLFRKAEPPVFGSFAHEIPILLSEYEYRFTQ